MRKAAPCCWSLGKAMPAGPAQASHPPPRTKQASLWPGQPLTCHTLWWHSRPCHWLENGVALSTAGGVSCGMLAPPTEQPAPPCCSAARGSTSARLGQPLTCQACCPPWQWLPFSCEHVKEPLLPLPPCSHCLLPLSAGAARGAAAGNEGRACKVACQAAAGGGPVHPQSGRGSKHMRFAAVRLASSTAKPASD